MSNYYKINEIAKLYGLCGDTLRYYEEQGLLSPSRGENNYRMYGIKDICDLNIIRNLRSLQMPVSKIKEYMEGRDINSTLLLLEEEVLLIEERIRTLKNLEQDVKRRVKEIETALKQELGVFKICEIPERTCYVLSEGITLEKDLDFLLKKLEKNHEERIYSFGNWKMGAILDKEWLEQGYYNRYTSAFYICENITDYDHILPRGTYATITYQGGYEHLETVLKRLEQYTKARGFCWLSAPIELYHIDVHDTGKREEYFTEVQVQIGKSISCSISKS